MRDVKMTTLIGKSVDWTVQVLFRPFQYRKWLALILMAMLAGWFGGGGNGGGGGGGDDKKNAPAEQTAAKADAIQAENPLPQAGSDLSPREVLRKGIAFAKSPLGISIIAVLVALGLLLFLFWVWLASRFKFVWFDGITRNSAAISEPYRRFKAQGNSLFAASVILTALFAVLILFWAAWIYLAGKGAGAWHGGFQWSFGAALRIFIIPAVSFIPVIIAGILLNVSVEHFVVPVMGMNGVSFMRGCGQFFQVFRGATGDFVLYCFVLLGSGLVAGAVAFAAIIIAVLAFLAFGLLIFGIPFLIIVKLFKLAWLFAVFAVVVGIPYILFALFVLLGVSLVQAVFFRSFSLHFLLSQKSPLLPASFEDYAAKNPVGGRAPFPLAPIVAVSMVFIFFIGGIGAAIAVPVFVKARQEAAARVAPR